MRLFVDTFLHYNNNVSCSSDLCVNDPLPDDAANATNIGFPYASQYIAPLHAPVRYRL